MSKIPNVMAKIGPIIGDTCEGDRERKREKERQEERERERECVSVLVVREKRETSIAATRTTELFVIKPTAAKSPAVTIYKT